MMRKILFFVLLSCFAFGQNKKIDSLKMIIKISKDDTLKVDNLNTVSGSFWDKNWDSARVYTMLSYNLAKKIDDKRGIFYNLINLGVYEDVGGNFNKSLEYYNEARKFLPQIKEKKRIANFYYNLGNLYLGYGKDEEAINSFNSAIVKYKEINKLNSVAAINGNLSLIYTKRSDYKKANEILFSNIKYFSSKNDDRNLAITYNNIGNNYSSLKEFKKALDYYKLGEEHSTKAKHLHFMALSNLNIGAAYGELKNIKQSEDYLLKSKELYTQASYPIGVQKVNMNLCELYLRKKQYQKANSIADAILANKELLKSEPDFINSHLMKGKSLYYLQQYKQALPLLETSYEKAKETKNNVLITNIIPFLINSKFRSNNDKHGEKLFKEYDSLSKLKNVNENKQIFFKLDTQFRTAEKETQIKTQEKQIDVEKTSKNFAISGIGFLLLLSGGGFLYFRNRQRQKELQNQNTLLSLQQNLNAMELQSLNKQLDPHEIKNLLASISPEIQEKAPESYRKMLKLFNITKASLNNNSLTESLENQAQQIDDFLSLEKSMLSENFEYSIENKIENKELQIPRLMLKNLVENSIKHGIKGNGGVINVSISEKSNFINIIVDDSGKGRKHAISLDSGIGTSTYQNLFATLNQKNKENATFEIIDKEQGTKVEVKIPVDYKYS